MKNIVYLLLFSLIIASCAKDEIAIEHVNDTNSLDLELIVNGFENDFAHFDNEEEFSYFIDGFSDLDEDGKELLLSKVKYNTLHQSMDEMYAKFEDMTNESQIQSELSKFPGLLEIIENEDGEKIVNDENVTQHTVVGVLNKDAFIKIGDDYIRFIGNYWIKSKSVSDLLSENTIEDIKKSKLTHGIAWEELYKEEDSRWGDLEDTHSWEKEKNKRWCKNDRKVKLQVRIFSEVNSFTDPIFGKTTQVKIIRKASVKPYRKGYPCVWYNYRSTITWNNFNMKYKQRSTVGVPPIAQENIVWTESNIVQYTREIKREKVIFFFIIEDGGSYDCEWESIKSNVTTTGIGNQWLIVNETF